MTRYLKLDDLRTRNTSENVSKIFDDQFNLKASIRKLLIDVTNPTAYDLDMFHKYPSQKNQK
ncbi:MAG: hypothetical protein QNJ33_10395 [Crocosphaera sp.]|nr:hypothetical protein [Crocosphaera sp.]